MAPSPNPGNGPLRMFFLFTIKYSQVQNHHALILEIFFSSSEPKDVTEEKASTGKEQQQRFTRYHRQPNPSKTGYLEAQGGFQHI